MARSKTNAPVDMSQLAGLLVKGIKNQAIKPNIFGYDPHEKQQIFHGINKQGRLYIGGNRSGKTYSSIAEDIWWLTDTHPYLDTPPVPVRGRVVTVDFTEGLEKIILPLFKSLLPSSYLINGSWDASYSKQFRTLTLKNGSTVEFMSYEQDLEKFAGTSRHFVHFDEEPPMHIWNECLARLVDTSGRWWISMTPVDGLTWTFEKVYEPGTDGTDINIGVVEADMLDNPHINPEAAEMYLARLDDDERKAREHGTYVQLGGLVYKKFSPGLHVIPQQIPPKNWLWYVSLDHGFNAPTAVLWHAVSPFNQIITFAEHYQNEWTIDQHAAKIHAMNAAFGKVPDYYVGDPAIAQRQGVTGTSIQTEYAIRGIGIGLGNNNVEVGVAKIQNYLRIDPKTNKPFYHITENCVNYINEMRKLRWKTFASKKMQFNNNPQEKIHKKDDHACDSARYFFSFLPDLTPMQMGEPDKPLEVPSGVIAHGGRKTYGSIDEVLNAMVKSKTTTTAWAKEVVGTDLTGLEYD